MKRFLTITLIAASFLISLPAFAAQVSIGRKSGIGSTVAINGDRTTDR